MAKIWYNLGLWFYNLMISLASPFNRKAKLMVTGRACSFTNLNGAFSETQSPVAWFHCASLGEFEQARPLIEAMKETFPHYKVLLTFFSPSGYEIRKNYPLADHVCYLPADTAKNAQRFVSRVKPSIALFAKYEFWYHYTKVLDEQEIPLISFSTIFRKSHPFFKKGAGFYRDILKRFDHFFVQDPHSQKMLQNIGIDHADVTGDTRFDRVHAIYQQRKAIPQVEAFVQGHLVFVIGSSWPADIEVMCETLNSFGLPIKVIVAPHEINEQQMALVEEKLSALPSVRFSQWEQQGDATKHRLLLIDNMGMLASLYNYADVAYVGGGFGKGLHNTLEAATYGIPIIIGKKFSKFREAVELTAKGGAFSVNNGEEFDQVFCKLFTDETFRKHAGRSSGEYVQQNLGATHKIIQKLSEAELLKPESPPKTHTAS